MYCTKCGSFLPEGVQVCPNCNEPVKQPQQAYNASSADQAEQNGVYYTPQTDDNSGSYYEPSNNSSTDNGNNGTYYNPPTDNGTDNYSNQPNGQNVYNSQPTVNSMNGYGNQQNGYNNQQQFGYDPNFMANQISNNLSSAKTLGILAIVLGLLISSIIGIICGAVGLSKANSVPDMLPDPNLNAEKAKVKKLNILGIVLPIAIRVVLIIIYVIFIVVLGAGFVTSYY